jgi:hypothetical protein
VADIAGDAAAPSTAQTSVQSTDAATCGGERLGIAIFSSMFSAK